MTLSPSPVPPTDPGSQSNKLPTPQIDVLLIGAGFSGIYLLHQLRLSSFSAKIVEAAPQLGGTWYWNAYPGARSDSDYYIYQLSIPELWKDDEWEWKERYASREDMMKYFEFVDRKLEISKDTLLGTTVTGAKFDLPTNRWTVQTDNGIQINPKFLIFCTGFASKPLYPVIPNLSSYKGIVHHTARWPQEGVDLEGKRVGVIGTGASGTQVIQAIAPKVTHLTVFQRTPNMALPLGQHQLSAQTKKYMKDELYPIYLGRRRQTFGGFHFSLPSVSVVDAIGESPEQVRLEMEELWSNGGFYFWLGAYNDIFSDQLANRIMYDFWRKKVLERLESGGVKEEVKEKLAPEEPPHYFGIKRPSLEVDYWETFALPNVELVELDKTPIVEATEKGLIMSDGVEKELDVLVLATGFDAVSGPISQVAVEGVAEAGEGELIGDKWKKGLKTYLGVMTNGYPNMFFLYGPHGPTQFCNGPTCIEIQANWIVSLLQRMGDWDQDFVEPTEEAEDEYSQRVNDIFKAGFWMTTKSSYNGGNVPGKKVESMNFTGGVPAYRTLLREVEEGGFTGMSDPHVLPTDHPDIVAYRKLIPHAKDGEISALRGYRDESELYWVSIQPYLASRGYVLRQRYSPSWMPSWTGKIRKGFSLTSYEDSLFPLSVNTLDAKRESDGLEVVLKIVETKTQEIEIARFLSFYQCRKDPRNHAVPLLDLLPIPNDEGHSIIVMPKLVPFDAVPFRFVGDVVEALRQFTETIQLMHENGIAHRDVCHFNLMMDSSQIFPDGSHFCQFRSPDGVTDNYTHYQERSQISGLRYYLTDFGISVHYPPNVANKTVLGIIGQDRTVPELSIVTPYDPFLVDIYQLGKAFLNLLQDYDDDVPGPLVSLLRSMTALIPGQRSTPSEVLKRISNFKKSVLKQRIWKKKADASHRLKARRKLKQDWAVYLRNERT